MMGESSEAIVSWFFSLAHELAHNAVAEHNSEHEVSICRKNWRGDSLIPGLQFYFSSICETFMMELAKLLSNGSR